MICGAEGKVKIHHEWSELQQITFHDSKVDGKNQQIEECAKQLRPPYNPAHSFSVNGMDGEQHSGQQWGHVIFAGENPLENLQQQTTNASVQNEIVGFHRFGDRITKDSMLDVEHQSNQRPIGFVAVCVGDVVAPEVVRQNVTDRLP